MTTLFIKRPILSLVISLIIVLIGIISLLKLPVAQFPDIVPPSVTVTAQYKGANAQVCANAVALPLERAINGVPGMTYMSTVTNNDGVTQIEVFFGVDVDPDLAVVNVQNRVSTVMDELPQEVIRSGVTTEKEVNSMLLYLNLTSKDTGMNEKFIYNFADINVLQELKRINGVGRCEIMGQQEYAMRIWLKPDKLIAYNISTNEIIQALQRQNIEAAPGKLGESSGKEKHDFQYVLKYNGKFDDVQQYKNVILRSNKDGSALRVRDVADVEFGSATYNMISKTDGHPSASIMIKQRPGSNASQVIKDIKASMQKMKTSSFPPGMEYNFAYDVSRFLDASMHEVVKTLFEAFLLVFLVVYLFLQDFRSTLIPAIAVPVSLIGAFIFLNILGFSINLLTLFALVLAIGIVVDDAIVVVEAVHKKMEEEHMEAKEATIAAMKEISGAILAITLVMSAVFVPVAFMTGTVGIFYKQFSLTLAFAVLISGINALTLSPALCALLLKRHQTETPIKNKNILQKFFSKFNAGYAKSEKIYHSILVKSVARKALTLVILGVCFIGIFGISKILPTGFIPVEDQGIIYVNVTTPPGATVERTEDVMHKIEVVAKKMNAVENVTTLAGYSMTNDVAGASYGMGMINLKSWEDRKESVFQIIDSLKHQSKLFADAEIDFFPPPTVPGFGNSSGFEFQLLDKTGSDDVNYTAEVVKKFVDSLNSSGIIKNAFSTYNADFPQYEIHVNYDQASKMGVDVENLMSTLQTLFGSYYTTNFLRFAQIYKVYLQAMPNARSTPKDLLDTYVKNDSGEMVSVSSFVTLEPISGIDQMTRYNMYTSAMISGEAADGYSSGEAIKSVENIAKRVLPKGFSYEWSGITREEIASGNQTAIIFAICILFVYLILSAQYESFLLPLAVICCIPFGIFGSYLSLKLFGLENNIYAQVALVMLIGLLAKNAILIIEIAEQKNKQSGLPILQSAIEGAISRLRPILMTAFAFNAGLIPLCISQGAGAVGNRSIGIAAAGGMLIGTVIGLFIIPSLYLIFASLQAKLSHSPEKSTATNDPS